MGDESFHDADVLDMSRALRYAALCYATCSLLYNGDRLRRGLDTLTPEVFWAGTLSGVVAIAAVLLALAGDHLAPLLMVGHGFSQALGVAAVHLPPHWSAFSDSLPDGGVDALTWVAVLAEIAGAVVFGAVGARVLRRRSRAGAPRDGPRAPSSATVNRAPDQSIGVECWPVQMTRVWAGRTGGMTPVPLSEVRTRTVVGH
jgi:hypothetical protein